LYDAIVMDAIRRFGGALSSLPSAVAAALEAPSTAARHARLLRAFDSDFQSL